MDDCRWISSWNSFIWNNISCCCINFLNGIPHHARCAKSELLKSRPHHFQSCPRARVIDIQTLKLFKVDRKAGSDLWQLNTFDGRSIRKYQWLILIIIRLLKNCNEFSMSTSSLLTTVCWPIIVHWSWDKTLYTLIYTTIFLYREWRSKIHKRK